MNLRTDNASLETLLQDMQSRESEVKSAAIVTAITLTRIASQDKTCVTEDNQHQLFKIYNQLAENYLRASDLNESARTNLSQCGTRAIKAFENTPYHAEAHVLKGRSYLKIIELSSKKLPSANRVEELSLKRSVEQNFESAYAQIQKALAIDIHNPAAHEALATLNGLKEKFDEMTSAHNRFAEKLKAEAKPAITAQEEKHITSHATRAIDQILSHTKRPGIKAEDSLQIWYRALGVAQEGGTAAENYFEQLNAKANYPVRPLER